MAITSFVPRARGNPAALDLTFGLGGAPSELRIYAAFMTPGWLAALHSQIHGCPTVRLRIGLDIPATPQQVLIDLAAEAQMPGRDIQLIKSTRSTFHPKVYWCLTSGSEAMMLGSSNPSAAAFGSNIEANVVIRGATGSEESRGARAVLDDLETLLERDERSGLVRRWRLPNDPLPTVRPAINRSALLDADVAATINSDGWEDSTGFQAAEVVARFDAPLSGLYGYADNTGRQAGIYVPLALRPLLLVALAAYGDDMLLSWRFRTLGGATLFSLDQRRRGVVASGRGPGSHNLAITAHRSQIAIPVVRLMRTLGITASDRVNAEYRLDLTEPVPRLWLVYTLQRPTPLIDSSEVVT